MSDTPDPYEVTPANVEYMIQTTQESIDEIHERGGDNETLRRLIAERARLYELLEEMKEEAELNQVDDDSQ